MLIDPIHYLAILDRKPGVLDSPRRVATGRCRRASPSSPRRSEELHGATPGARRFVHVLQLLAEHPLAQVRQAVEKNARADVFIDAEAVAQRTRSLGAIESLTHPTAPETPASPTAAGVQVPLPDLSRFDQLLGGHDDQAEYNS